MTFPISVKIQDGGRNSETSNLLRGHKGFVPITKGIKNFPEIALSLTVFEINNIFFNFNFNMEAEI